MKMKQKIKQFFKEYNERGKYLCERSSLISMVSLAYILKKDFALIISSAIKNNLLTPYYCVKYDEKEGEEILLCKKQIFYKNFIHYIFYLDNYYFSLDEVIQLENYYNIISNNFLSPFIPLGDNYTTEKNITKVLNRTITESSDYYKYSLNPYEKYFMCDLTIAIFSGCYNIYSIIKACYNKRLFFKKRKYELNEDDFNKILFLFEYFAKENETLINKDNYPILFFLISKDPAILEEYVRTRNELSDEEEREIAFYLSFVYDNTAIGNIIKNPVQTKDAPKQAGSKLFCAFAQTIKGRTYENPNDIFPILIKELTKLLN